MSESAPTQNPSGVENGHAPSQSHANDAASLALQHGGNPTGRVTQEGNIPGTAPAAEERKRRDRERKRDARSRDRAALGKQNAPPLPSRTDVVQTEVDAPRPVHWSADLLAPLSSEIISAVEKFCVNSLAKKAAMLPNAPDKFSETVRADAAWNPVAKVTLEKTVPEVAAKLLNKAGVSAEYAPEIAMSGAIAQIAIQQQILSAKLDKMIKEQSAEKKNVP